MALIPSMIAGFSIRLGTRAVIVTGVYVAAAAAILLTVILLRGIVEPQRLRGLLGLVFISTLASGLEPATAKAAALADGGPGRAGPSAYLAVGGLKGLLVSPVLALLWRYADPAVGLATLAWTPALAVAGFWATDLRVLLDLRGRYALAIGLKQGGQAGGVVAAGLLLAAGASPSLSVGLPAAIRIALLCLWPLLTPPCEGRPTVWRQAHGLLWHTRWVDLAAVSVVAAIGGSTDRVFGLRYLTPAVYGAYYVTYELFTKFWLIPYVLAPILFARQAARDRAAPFIRGAWALTATAGAGFLAAVALAMAFAPALLARVIGASFGYATLVFALAVVLSSICQLRVAQLQGAGRSRQAMLAVGASAAASVPLFMIATRDFGAPGLLVAWLFKVAVEMAVLAWRPRSRRLRAA